MEEDSSDLNEEFSLSDIVVLESTNGYSKLSLVLWGELRLDNGEE